MLPLHRKSIRFRCEANVPNALHKALPVRENTNSSYAFEALNRYYEVRLEFMFRSFSLFNHQLSYCVCQLIIIIRFRLLGSSLLFSIRRRIS